MQFSYTKHNLSKSEAFRQRCFEILPGMTSWTILIGMTALSIAKPVAAAILIIAFYLFWILKILYMTIFLVLSYARLRMEEAANWDKRIREIDDPEHVSLNTGDPETFSRYLHLRELARLRRSGSLPPLSKNIYHLVIYPVAKETREVVEPGIQSLCKQHFPTKRILFVFALEKHAPDAVQDGIRILEQKYKTDFLDVLTVIHPKNIPGETVVKGANAACAARRAAEFFATKNIPFENIIVSCFDADTVVHPRFFSVLTYYFLITPNRLRASFQPVPVYHNNIWEAPGFARVIETGSSFFQLIEATDPEKLVTFSSHSMSFKALVEADYWPVDMISDDSAIYWKCFIHYDGDYRTVPIFTTLSMDIAASPSIWQTAKSVYKQKRRWAWGVENFPVVMRAFLKSRNISLRDKWRLGFKLLEGHIAWATWGFLLSIIGWLPGLFARQSYQTSVAYYNVPRISNIVFWLAAISLMCSIFISIKLLPKRKTRFPVLQKIKHVFEWLMIPFILLVFSSLPSLDAQTRMMFGRRMEFKVTDKHRKKDPSARCVPSG